MGANYDLVIARTVKSDVLLKSVKEFLSFGGVAGTTVTLLESVDIHGNKAILVGPSQNEWTQVASDPSSLGVDLATWFHGNPLAVHLSNPHGLCIHVWSLNSGQTVGYALYSFGLKFTSECIFSRFATNRGQLMPDVPTPDAVGPRRGLHGLLNRACVFADVVNGEADLERGMAKFVSLFGFDVHLVDFLEALDDRRAIAILDGNYQSRDIADWTAILWDGKIRRVNPKD